MGGPANAKLLLTFFLGSNNLLLENELIFTCKLIRLVCIEMFGTSFLSMVHKLIALLCTQVKQCLGAYGRWISLFTKQSPLSNLRDSLKLYVQRPRSDFLRSSFSHRASILWNNLPMYLKSKPNIVSFKSALKAKSDILDKITFNGLQGINKDIVNYIY